ncbi:hypothetical protein DM860_013529 [Cuscuta australis]|uniref:DUF4378 domain-containing protein n=1 Tax=Cuscuta australis TaxID=267555 RepID=A0A328EE40_9ASTE|nr:hypothetical protein DM860_013529 [Cuscuta australis]
MESNESVIANLLGFGKSFPPRTPCERRTKKRMPSEHYLQKTASIGLWENSSFSVKKKSYNSVEYDKLLGVRRHSSVCKPFRKVSEPRHSSMQRPKSAMVCPKQSPKHYAKLGDGVIVIPEKKSASRFYKSKRGISSIGNSLMNLENVLSIPSRDVVSSYSSAASVRQESLNGSPQNQVGSMENAIIYPNSQINTKEGNQRSPNSVLEPRFKEIELLNSECFHHPVLDVHSVVAQLKLLDDVSDETYSEASEMALSAAEDTKKGYFYSSQEHLGVFRTEESRDFSYLVDVLDEARLHFEVDLESCNSLESPINPLLFDTLEKKYGKQKSWSKPERRLLFDRINLGLSAILGSFFDIHIASKSLRMRLCRNLRRSEVEEELWMSLVNEGTKTEWMEMEREIGVVCDEVENYLFDELAEEFYCI